MNCSNCNKEISFWERGYKIDNKNICPDCFTNHYAKIKTGNIEALPAYVNTLGKTEHSEVSFISPKGRIKRSVYLYRSILLAIPTIILSYTYVASPGPVLYGVLLLFSIIGTVLQIIQGIKRLHDVNLDGIYILLMLIPLVNIIF